MTDQLAESAYVLCALTALACGFLLLREFATTRARLLLWSGICFAALAIENAVLFVDLVIFPTTVDLSVIRNAIALAGLACLLYGLIWDARSR